MFPGSPAVTRQRIWIYRILVVIACGLMLVSFLLPWWSTGMVVQGFSRQDNAIQVFGYGLKHQLNQLEPYILDDVTPFYQNVLAFVYLGVSLAAAAGSILIKGRKGAFLLLLCGLGYLAYMLAATITQRLGDFGIAMQGWSTISNQVRKVSFESSLGLGYYLAYASSILLTALATLRFFATRPKLIEEPQTAVEQDIKLTA